MSNLAHYTLLAPLFVYPDERYPELAKAAERAMRADYPVAADLLQKFIDMLPPVDAEAPEIALNETQEIFTRSFEVQSLTTLDVGYIVFGDDYKRAELLVNLNREHRLVENDCGTELSDHLPNVLRLLAVWEDEDLALEFVQQILHPSLQRMVEEFHPERIERRNAIYIKHHRTLIVTSELRAMMYCYLLQSLRDVLRRDFEYVHEAPLKQSDEFLRSITRELEIADKGAGHRPSAGRTP
jgi:nitrate reductase assembly molybdenum cofactor insertion protein NarJ